MNEKLFGRNTPNTTCMQSSSPNSLCKQFKKAHITQPHKIIKGEKKGFWSTSIFSK